MKLIKERIRNNFLIPPLILLLKKKKDATPILTK